MNHTIKGKEVKSLQETLNQEQIEPIWQIKDMIERDILRDILLEEELGIRAPMSWRSCMPINPASAAKGINLLVEEGILYKKRGIGMFVAEGAKAAIMKKRKEHFFDDYIKGLLSEAASLGISRKELIEMIADAGETEKKTPEKG